MALQFKKSSIVNIEIPYRGEEATKAAELLVVVANNTTVEELEILAKVAKKPLVKLMAIKEARKHV